MPRIIRAADCRRMPWKNGGGETIEMAVAPAASSLDDFDWRISMARVAGDGPFSMFPGIDRTLAVLDGNGIRLSVRGRAGVELSPASAPFSFAADVDVEAALLDGPITDLNVMTRRGRFRHRVRSLRPGVEMDRQIEAAAVLLFCHEGRADVEADGVVHRLDPHDSLLAGPVAGLWRIVPRGLPRLFIVEIDAA